MTPPWTWRSRSRLNKLALISWMMINQVCRLIVKWKGMDVSVSSGYQPAPVGVDVLSEFTSFRARLSGLANLG